MNRFGRIVVASVSGGSWRGASLIRLMLFTALLTCSSCANLEPMTGRENTTSLKACRPMPRSDNSGREVGFDEGGDRKPEPNRLDVPPLSAKPPKDSFGSVATKATPATVDPMPLPPIPEGEQSTVGSRVEGLTLANLEQIALEHNPTLRMAVAEIEKERGLRLQAGLSPNPTLGYVQSDATRSNESHTNGLLVQQTFITGSKLEKSQAIETFGIQDANWQLQAQQLRVLTDVRLRYFDLIGAQMQVDLVREIQDIMKQSLKAAQALFKGQQVPETDVLQAEVQVSELELALKNAQAEQEAAWKRLAVIIGQPQLPLCRLAEPEDSLPEFLFEEEWQRLLAKSPQLRSTEAQVQVAHRQLIRDQATPIPDVTVQVVGDYDREMDFGTINALVALPIPVFDRNQGQIYNSVHELHRAKAEVERVQLVLRDQLVNTYRDYVQARNEVQQLQESMLPKLQKTLDLTVKGYQQGELGYQAVLAVQERYRQTSLNRITALTRARQIGAEIVGLQLTGGLNPAAIGTAIQEGGGQRRAVQQLLERQDQNRLNNYAPAAID